MAATITTVSGISLYGVKCARFDASSADNILTSGTNQINLAGYPYMTVSAYFKTPYIVSGTFVAKSRFYDSGHSLLNTDTWHSLTSADTGSDWTRYHTTYYSGVGAYYTTNAKYIDLQFGFVGASGQVYLDGLKAEVTEHPTIWTDYAAGNVTLPITASDVLYASSATVESLKPAQANADKTSLNTSADTSSVSGKSSSLVLYYSAADPSGNKIQTTGATPMLASYLKYGTGIISDPTIESLKPAEVGADVTNNHTANNTENVGAQAAKNILYYGYSGAFITTVATTDDGTVLDATMLNYAGGSKTIEELKPAEINATKGAIVSANLYASNGTTLVSGLSHINQAEGNRLASGISSTGNPQNFAANSITNTALASDTNSLSKVSGGAVSVNSGNVALGGSAALQTSLLTTLIASNGTIGVGLKDTSNTYTVNNCLGPNIAGSGLNWNGVTAKLDSLNPWAVYSPVSVTMISGTLLTGTVANIQTMSDGSVCKVDEGSGTPGYAFNATFSGMSTTLPSSTKLRVHASYQGTNAHIVSVRMYNYSTGGYTWLTSLTNELNASAYTYKEIPINKALFTNNGNAIVQILHESAGTPAHSINIDYIAIATV